MSSAKCLKHLALLRISYDALPLDDADRQQIITWLNMVACELEKGEHLSSREIICLRYDPE